METKTELQTTQSNGSIQKDTSVKGLFARIDVRQKFEEMLGKRAPSFITSVLQIVASNDLLSKAEPSSIYHAAAVAATLDLPLNNNLGFAFIVPYNSRQKDGSFKTVAQFQMGYKGFIQLVQRTGQCESIYASEIYEGQLLDENPLDGYEFDFKNKISDRVIGYACRLRLLNGFKATLYMSREKLEAHGKRFSQTFKKGFGLWNDDFDSMAKKTVTKLLLSRYAPMSIELQRAVVTDQAIVNDPDATDITYIDNTEVVVEIDKESERIQYMVEDCTTVKDLSKLEKLCTTPELQELYKNQMNHLLDNTK